MFFLIGTYAIRGVAWWPLAAIPAIAGTLLTEPVRTRPERVDPPLIRRLNVVLAGMIVLICVALLPVWRPLEPGLETPLAFVGEAPPGITGELRAIKRPGDRVFNPQPWGSWFEYALPDLPVVLDSRIELFKPAVWDAYQQVTDGHEGWADQLKDWGVTIVVVAGDHEDAFAKRLTDAGWVPTFKDDDGQVFVAPDRG